MSAPTVGIAHPGAMGAAVGAAAAAGGARVCWASQGRSDATRQRARESGIEDLGEFSRLAEEVDVLLGVCPPSAALALAEQVGATGFAGTYVDANATAPETAERVAELVGASASFVDGGIVGPPPSRSGTSRLYLSGPGAESVAALFSGTVLGTVVLEGPPGRASALKASYSAYTKASTALLATIRALARHHGVDEALLAEWELSRPRLPERSERDPRNAAPKAWRFSGEMAEIASALRAAGLPGGALEGASEVYRRLAPFKDADEPPSLDELLRTLAPEAAPAGD